MYKTGDTLVCIDPTHSNHRSPILTYGKEYKVIRIQEDHGRPGIEMMICGETRIVYYKPNRFIKKLTKEEENIKAKEMKEKMDSIRETIQKKMIEKTTRKRQVRNSIRKYRANKKNNQ